MHIIGAPISTPSYRHEGTKRAYTKAHNVSYPERILDHARPIGIAADYTSWMQRRAYLTSIAIYTNSTCVATL
jgi:hypothetical protein